MGSFCITIVSWEKAITAERDQCIVLITLRREALTAKSAIFLRDGTEFCVVNARLLYAAVTRRAFRKALPLALEG